MATSAEPRPRKHSRSEDSPISDRPVSSLEMVLYRAAQVRRAFAAQDEDAARGELRALAAEAERLAAQDGLLRSTLAARIRVATEREPTGRIA